ncbi:MAG TPA: hypothetical protein VHZ51_21750 [Ktedonobacteraceae bacterium]|jgi:hypothetical protein|nr:hypothetical protein [Ktedonobacteraceae bacterium]
MMKISPIGLSASMALPQLDIILGMTRSRTARDLLAIADPQRPIDPHLIIPTTVLQWGFDAMSIG